MFCWFCVCCGYFAPPKEWNLHDDSVVFGFPYYVATMSSMSVTQNQGLVENGLTSAIASDFDARYMIIILPLAKYPQDAEFLILICLERCLC